MARAGRLTYNRASRRGSALAHAAVCVATVVGAVALLVCRG
jgi:hypothetical protein